MNDQRKYKMQKSNVRQKIWYRSKNYGWLVYEYTSISYYSQHTPVFTVCKGKKVYCEKHIEWYMGCGMPVCQREAKIYPKKKREMVPGPVYTVQGVEYQKRSREREVCGKYKSLKMDSRALRTAQNARKTRFKFFRYTVL